MRTVTEQTVRVDSNKDDSKNLNMTEDSDKVNRHDSNRADCN